jgi:hypothetical protein
MEATQEAMQSTISILQYEEMLQREERAVEYGD